VNHYSGFEKAIPAIPSLPGFKTSAGMSKLNFLKWSCDQEVWDPRFRAYLKMLFGKTSRGEQHANRVM
jgi:hypothetical protein